MPGDEPSPDEPTAGQAAPMDRTATERLATAAQRAVIGEGLDAHEGDGPEEPADADEAGDAADKTDMGAVGDDGQVFGG